MNIIRKLLDAVFSPEHEKTVAILLPAISIMIAGIIVIPQLVSALQLAGNLSSGRETAAEQQAVIDSANAANLLKAEETSSETVPMAAESPISDSQSLASVSFPKAVTPVHLTSTSVGNDLFIFVRNSSSELVKGVSFGINLSDYSGNVVSLQTDQEGTAHFSSLSPGTYAVSLTPHDGFSEAAPISVSVSGTFAYTPISNISELVTVHDVSELSGEIKTATYTAAHDLVAEEVSFVIQSPVSNSKQPAADFFAPVLLPDESFSAVSEPLSGQESGDFFCSADSADSKEHSFLSFDLSVGESPEVSDDDSADIPLQDNVSAAPSEMSGTSFTLDVPADNEEQLSSEFSPENDSPSAPEGNLPGNPAAEAVEAVEIAQAESSQAGWCDINGKTYYLNGKGQCITGFVSIDNKLYYFDSTGAKANSLGIDVSFYNGTIDWEKVKASGIDFVIIRCGGRGWSTGALYDDTCFTDYLLGAKRAGLDVGVYFYSTATNILEAIEEASVTVWRLNHTPLEYPVFIDLEYSGDYPYGRSDTLSPAERVQIADAFCRTIQSAGYKAGIYSSQSFYTEGLNYSALARYNIWIASYTENNALPNFSGRYDLWQLTDRGRVPGIGGYVDIDVIRG